MTDVVVDASVLVCLFDQESAKTQWAERLLELTSKGDFLIICPDLVLLELTNVLVKMKKAEPKIVDEFVRMLESVGVEFMQILPGDMGRVAGYMRKYDLTAYDACYLFLAKKSEMTLITEDRELLKVKGCVSLTSFFDGKITL